jgi:hypothetical protein
MTMTDARPKLSTAEWRLYIVAALAVLYVATWRVLDERPQPRSRTAPTIGAPRAVWLDDLPANQRPALTVPAGWVVASRGAGARVEPTAAVQPARARPVRVTRPLRVRTRSS